MGRFSVLLPTFLCLLLLIGCTQPSEQDPPPPPPPTAVITHEEGVALVEQLLGTVDKETGNLMSYTYEETVELDGISYYNYRVSWLVDESHVSYLANYLVSADGQVLRELLANSIA